MVEALSCPGSNPGVNKAADIGVYLLLGHSGYLFRRPTGWVAWD